MVFTLHRCFPSVLFDCRASGSQAIIQSACNRKNSCKLTASNDVFGDPCFLAVKYISLTYECVVPGKEKLIEIIAFKHVKL